MNNDPEEAPQVNEKTTALGCVGCIVVALVLTVILYFRFH
jgi:hypothetical protein